MLLYLAMIPSITTKTAQVAGHTPQQRPRRTSGTEANITTCDRRFRGGVWMTADRYDIASPETGALSLGHEGGEL